MPAGDPLDEGLIICVVTESDPQSVPASRSFLTGELFRQHPGLALTVTYLLLSAIGVMYNAFLFLNFRINFLYYSEPADFLMAALRDPIVILLSVLPYPFVKAADSFGHWLRRRFKRYGRLSESMERGLEKRKISPKSMMIASVALWSIAFTGNYANFTADRIREGRGRRVEIHLSHDAPPIPDLIENPILIGTTNRFVFLHYPERRATHVVPMEMVSRLIITRASGTKPGSQTAVSKS